MNAVQVSDSVIRFLVPHQSGMRYTQNNIIYIARRERQKQITEEESCDHVFALAFIHVVIIVIIIKLYQ